VQSQQPIFFSPFQIDLASEQVWARPVRNFRSEEQMSMATYPADQVGSFLRPAELLIHLRNLGFHQEV